jgi:hypothetical protein|tara:strand:+ start:627 stop:752 length:126 start_codon:yes stop_codon:yes gene_type:complete
MTWSNILNTHPATIKKKLSWYEKQKAQTSLDEFLKEDEDEN